MILFSNNIVRFIEYLTDLTLKLMKKSYTWLNHVFNFIAVILGVYLAFYINQRSKTNQDKKESQILMQSLHDDLSEDIKIYEGYQIPENIRIQDQVSKLISKLSSDNLEDLNQDLPKILEVENFSPTTTTYISMKSSGKLRLIEDLELKKKLTNYYEGLAIESMKKGEFQADYFTNEILKWYSENVDMYEMQIINNEEMIIFRNKLIIYESLINQKIKAYKSLVVDSKTLKPILESFVNKD